MLKRNEDNGEGSQRRIRSLLIAAEGQKQLLACVDAVGVRDFGIGLRDAAPRGGAAVGRLCNPRQCVALLNGDLQIGFQARDFGWYHNFRTGGDAGGVNDARVSR